MFTFTQCKALQKQKQHQKRIEETKSNRSPFERSATHVVFSWLDGINICLFKPEALMFIIITGRTA